jgi:hypothetical protein
LIGRATDGEVGNRIAVDVAQSCRDTVDRRRPDGCLREARRVAQNHLVADGDIRQPIRVEVAERGRNPAGNDRLIGDRPVYYASGA